jgi:hypothetical protein
MLKRNSSSAVVAHHSKTRRVSSDTFESSIPNSHSNIVRINTDTEKLGVEIE